MKAVAASFVAAAVPVLVTIYPLHVGAQPPAQSYLRNSQNEPKSEEERVRAVIARAEEHFKLGELNLKDNKRQAAREEFDRAVDTVLESGMDVRANPRLNHYYDELLERIYRLETSNRPDARQQPEASTPAPKAQGQTPQPAGFVEQKFEPSPLDELSKMVLTREDLRKPPSPSTKRACATVKVESLELRGFRLGMSLTEVRARIPDLVVTRENEFGESQSLTQVRSNKYLSRNATLKGVLTIGLRYLDGRVSSVAMIYDDSLRWESGDEFAGQVAASLGLPEWWARLEGGGYGAYDDQLRALRCEDFVIVAGLKRFSMKRLPEVILYDPATTDALRKRAAEEAERKRLEEERRKRSFKP